MQIYYVIGVVVVLVFLFFIVKFLFNPKNSTWQAEVIEKSEKENAFSVVVIDGNNKKMTVPVSKILWKNLERGDRIEKRKGDLFPRKI